MAARLVGTTDNSVMWLQGYLGQPPGGFPEPLRSRIMKGARGIEGRPGASMEPLNMVALRARLRVRPAPAPAVLRQSYGDRAQCRSGLLHVYDCMFAYKIALTVPQAGSCKAQHPIGPVAAHKRDQSNQLHVGLTYRTSMASTLATRTCSLLLCTPPSSRSGKISGITLATR